MVPLHDSVHPGGTIGRRAVKAGVFGERHNLLDEGRDRLDRMVGIARRQAISPCPQTLGPTRQPEAVADDSASLHVGKAAQVRRFPSDAITIEPLSSWFVAAGRTRPEKEVGDLSRDVAGPPG